MIDTQMTPLQYKGFHSLDMKRWCVVTRLERSREKMSMTRMCFHMSNNLKNKQETLKHFCH